MTRFRATAGLTASFRSARAAGQLTLLFLAPLWRAVRHAATGEGVLRRTWKTRQVAANQ
jgi:hypothetical protein